MAQQIMGNRILGGIGAPDSRAGASFGAGVDTALNQRTSRQQMQEREQMMGLRASQEQRAQQQFELQQRQAAASAARAAQQRAALQAFTAGLQIPGTAPAGVTAPAGGTSAPALRPPPGAVTSGGSFPLAAPAQRSILVPGLSFPAAPGAVTGGAGGPRVAGGAGADTLAGAPGIPTLPDGSPDWAAFEQQLRAASTYPTGYAAGQVDPRLAQAIPGMVAPGMVAPGMSQFGPVPLSVDQITEVDPTASAALQDLQAISRRVDINNAARRIGNSVIERTSQLADYALRTPEEGARRAEAEVESTRIGNWYASDEARAIFQEDPDLLQTAARDPLAFYEQYSGETPAAGLPPRTQPVTTSPAVREPLGTAEDFPSAVRQGAPGAAGVQTPSASPVQQAAAETDGAPSERYINNADLIQMDRDRLAQQVAREQQLLQYLVSTGDVGGYQQGQAIVAAQGQLAKLEIEQRYLDGMVAITSIENGNFGPLQTLIQQRPEFQGRQVSVVPYTDGTVEIFVDGQLEEEMSWGDLVENLKFVYDQGYQTFLGEQADALAEMQMKDFENRSAQAAQAKREIAVAVTEDALRRAAEEGELQSVVDANGVPTLQMRIKGAWTGVYIEQVQEQVPGGEPSIRLILRRVDTGEAVPLTGE